MKALTLWQPWASLIAIGAKRYETRSWPAPKSLPPGSLLAIHAAQRCPPQLSAEMTLRVCQTLFILSSADDRTIRSLPRGSVLAICRFLGCWRTEELQPTPHQRLMGDWTPGRFAWELDVVIDCGGREVPAKGRQGLWEWEPPAWLARELVTRASGAVQ